MTTSFVFRPHVRETETVVTPDLLIDRLEVARGNTRRPVPVDRLCMASDFQVVGTGTVADAAVVLIGAGGGMLIGAASDHRRPGEPPGGLACAKPVCREVWRYADVADHADALILSASARRRDGGTKLLQRGTTGGLLAETDLPPGRAVLCTGLEPGGDASFDAYEITLEDPVLGRRITLRYGITELAAGGGC